MYTKINAQLVQIKSLVKKKRKWENQLADYDVELTGIENELIRLESKLQDEKQDVKKLERIGITNLIQTFLGSKYEKLNQEKQEVIAVQLQLEEAEKTKHEIHEAMNELDEKLQEVKQVEADYEFLLAEKERIIIGTDAAYANRLFELSENEGDREGYMIEVEEAIEAGNKVATALGSAIASLESAEGWGVFDMVGGGMISSFVKHERIDKATDYIHQAQTRMREFQKELLDVDEESELEVDISGLLKFADFFFDGFIVDWMVQGRIQESLQQVKNQHSNVVKIVRKLEVSLIEKERELSVVQEEKKALVEEV